MKSFNLKRILDTASGVAMLILLGNSAHLEAQTIAIKYPSRPPASGSFSCVGDTILVTATADNIDGLVLPKSDHWSGDADDAIVAQTANSITKRFFTYHPYLESNPTTNSTRNLDFTIRLKDGSTKTVSQAITAKSCEPRTLQDPKVTVTSYGNKYNLGNINFVYAFENETSDTSKGRIQVIPEFTPPQPFHLLESKRSTEENQYNVSYRAIQISDAIYNVRIQYNEGDSIRNKVFGPYNFKLTQPLGTLKPEATSFCPENDLVFSLELSSDWQNIMNQTIDKDESKIESCFDWSGSPAPVTFTRRENNKYFFSTKVAGTSTTEYHCKMSVTLKYANQKNDPTIDISFDATYDVPVEEVQFNERKGFTQHEITACQGDAIPLPSYIEEGASVQEYRDGNGNKIATPGAYIASKTEEVSVSITAPCPWTDKLKINVIDKSQIQSLSPSNDTLICAGETISFSASANSPVTWTIDNEGGDMKSWEETEAGKVYEYTFTNNATIQAGVSQCGMDTATFRIQVVTPPDVKINAATYECPYKPVTLNGTGGDNPTYTLYDLQANKDITKDMGDYISAAGLTGYPMRPDDHLKLTYKAGNQIDAPSYKPATLTCYSTAEATITAFPLPPISISYDDTPYANGGTACVPREAAFSLTASGAESYEWLDLIGQTDVGQPGRSLELAKDSILRLRGVENVHQCFDTFAINCVVSVEKADRVTSAEDCPGEPICFKADELPSTTYAWYGPDDNPLPNETGHQLCRKYQKGEDGVYTLKTQRFGCSESLPYTLTLHPAPDIQLVPNAINPDPDASIGYLCVGDDLVFNYRTGLPEGIGEQHEFTFNGDPMEIEGNGDVLRYLKPNIQVSDEGTYKLKVTTITANACSATNEFKLTIEEPALVRIALNADTACEEEDGWLKAEVTPAEDNYTYEWRIDGQPMSTNPDMTINWTRNDRDIHLEVQQLVCKITADTTVTIIARPILSDMPKDTGICQGFSICLSPVADIEPQEIIWYWINSNGKPSQIPLPTLQFCQDNADESMNGRYFVEVANQAGSKRCARVSDTTRLTVHPTPDLRIDGPTFLCDGSTVTLTAVSRIADAFHWQHNGATTAAISVDKAGQYTVTVSSAYGCQNTDSKSLEARPTPYFSLPPDTSICRGTSFLIYGPDGMDTYHWNDGSQSKDMVAEQGGWYILTVYRNECPYSDSLYVRQTFCGQFHFPTAFTPNDNRVNDTWGAISAAKDEDMAEYDLMVFDRNGKKVFHGKRISEQWDGRYKGELCPPGVYMYSFKALEKLEGIKYQASGTVTIVQ